MKIKTMIVATILISLMFLITAKIVHGYTIVTAKQAEEALQAKIDDMSTTELVDYIAPKYGQDPALIKKIISCESNSNPETIHDGGYGKGSTGIHKRTFEYWQKKFDLPELVYESNFDQITMMSIAFSKGEDYRDDWTTYVAYTHGGVYKFYSHLLKKNFVVVCK